MSIRSDESSNQSSDVLGLIGSYPRPGWVVLDAIRESAFTGEVVCVTTPGVTVFADRGHIYLAEFANDPTLGTRLVEAGALTASQLEQGALLIGGVEHLGALFDRVSDVDRHAVLTATQILTDDCVTWLAAQRVHHADAIPYRYHPSGAHRWPADEARSPAIGAFPAPPPGSVPVALPPPRTPAVPLPPPTSAVAEASQPSAPMPAESDDVIRWNEPSWLDDPLADTPLADTPVVGLIAPLPMPSSLPTPSVMPLRVAPPAAPTDPARDAARDAARDNADDPFDVIDWAEKLGSFGLPDRDAEPVPDAGHLPPVAPQAFDRFEVIWPSGEIDEQFGGQPTEAFPNPDIDRAGPTARMVRGGGLGASRSGTAEAVRAGDLPGVVGDDVLADALGSGVDDIEEWLASEAERESVTDDVVLAVRQAVASIETGSLAKRDRRFGPRSGVLLGAGLAVAGDGAILPPGRVAVRAEASDAPMAALRMARPDPSAGSVFDEVPPMLPPPAHLLAAEAAAAEDGGERVSALRRLIGSLRRR